MVRNGNGWSILCSWRKRNDNRDLRLSHRSVSEWPTTKCYGLRRLAAQRPRPLILDDDGDLVYDQPTPQDPEAFTRLRHTDLIDAAVDRLA